MKLNILNTLFKGTRALTLCEGISVQNRGPKGMYSCALNPKGTPAKISYAAIAMEYLLKGRVAALETIEGSDIYAEVWNEEKTERTESVNYSGVNQIYWEKGKLPSNTSHLILPFVVFALSSDSEMSETKKAYEACVKEYLATEKVTAGSVFYFCDCFYYEWKTKYPTEVETNDFINLDTIKQACRTKNVRVLDFGVTEVPKFIEVEIDTTDAPEAPKNGDRYQACLNGDYIINHCWDLERRVHIPDKSKLESYIPNDSFFAMIDLISSELKQVQARMSEGCYGIEAIGNNYVNIIMCGKPGTGKTSLAFALGAAFGMPVRTVTISKNTEEDTFQGMTKVIDGGFKFTETPFGDVYKEGGFIVIEEGNLADPAVLMGALGQAIEKPFILYEDGYKEVRRHPLCVIIVTMNTGTQGSCEPSEAFTSRCPDVFMLDDPTEEQFIDILVKNGNKKADCERVYNAYAKILATLTGSEYNAEDVAMSVTLRHCLAALRQMRYGRKFKQAIKDTMCGAIGIKDTYLAKQIYETVIEPMRD